MTDGGPRGALPPGWGERGTDRVNVDPDSVVQHLEGSREDLEDPDQVDRRVFDRFVKLAPPMFEAQVGSPS
jgi:hypothetical protein